MHPDVVVIGGGIVGCSCAYYLARAGVKVHLLEKNAIGAGASRAGMMHIVTWEEPEVHLELARRSKRLYEALSEELPIDIHFRKTGSLAIVEKPESLEAFSQTIRRLRQWGVECEMLDTAELLKLEPRIAPDVAGGACFSGDAMVNPLYATQALARQAQAFGATIESAAEVTGFELAANKDAIMAVVTRRGRIPTRGVVIAAGAWSGAVGRLAGLEIPIEPRKGTLVVTAPIPDDVFQTKIILAAGYMESLHAVSGDVAVAANLQQARNGNLVLGSSRQFVGFDQAVDPAVVAQILQRCVRFFPVLERVRALRAWTGFRPYTPDLLPIISPVASLAGMFIAAGHEGLGITEAPITGKLISQLITEEQVEIALDQLTYSRFLI
jgi:glycine/D-amino acid oxidase-like deaminating enzyme